MADELSIQGTWVAPIDPIPIGNGLGFVLPLPDGRVIWQILPYPEDAPAAALAVLGDYVETLRSMGHTVVIGDQAALVVAAAEALGL